LGFWVSLLCDASLELYMEALELLQALKMCNNHAVLVTTSVLSMCVLTVHIEDRLIIIQYVILMIFCMLL
jgi:hypothetical protein